MKHFLAAITAFVLLLSFAAPADAAETFSDVRPKDWFYEAVTYCAEEGLVNGMGGGRFEPQTPLNRAMFVTILGRFSGADVRAAKTPFSDVEPNEWYAPYVLWASEQHITEGVGGGRFDPKATLTREQLAAMISRYLTGIGRPILSTVSLADFTDGGKISSYARTAVAECCFAGLMSGMGGGVFAPKKTATRAEVCTVVQRLVRYCREEKTMDLYLVAGQSNAVGYTKVPRENEAVARELREHPEYGGFSNVFYYGCIDEPFPTSLQPTAIGQGFLGECIGPEIGMASVLDPIYGAIPNTDACIVKFARGGTSLLNMEPGCNTWSPPSAIAAMREADIRPETGILYRHFLTVVSDAANAIRAAGYDRVRIMGIYWMQGENDTGRGAKYRTTFAQFASDLRQDLDQMFLQDLSLMPILIGEIAPNFGETPGDGTASVANAQFIKIQNLIAQENPNCFIVGNSRYSVNGVGGDLAHWGFFEMLAIGRDTANVFLALPVSIAKP